MSRLTHRAARIAFAAAVAVNLLVLYWPRQVADGGVPYADKVVHAAIFGAVAASGRWLRLPARWLVPVLAVHAVLSEVLQRVALPARSGDPTDVVADLVGIALGVVLAVATRPADGSLTHERGADRAATGRDS